MEDELGGYDRNTCARCCFLSVRSPVAVRVVQGLAAGLTAFQEWEGL